MSSSNVNLPTVMSYQEEMHTVLLQCHVNYRNVNLPTVSHVKLKFPCLRHMSSLPILRATRTEGKANGCGGDSLLPAYHRALQYINRLCEGKVTANTTKVTKAKLYTNKASQ